MSSRKEIICSIKAMADTLRNNDLLNTKNIKKLQEYLNSDDTKAKASEGIEQLDKYTKIIEKEFKDIHEDDRQGFIAVTSYMLMQHYDNECGKIVLKKSANYITQLEELVDSLMDQLMEEKRAHNETREKFNVATVPAQIKLEGLKNLRMTVTTSESLSSKDIADLSNKVTDGKTKLEEKMKRLGVPHPFKDKVSYVFAGLNPPNKGKEVKINHKK